MSLQTSCIIVNITMLVLDVFAGNSEELDDAMVSFALAYADQNEKDYNALSEAAKKGRIKVALPEVKK